MGIYVALRALDKSYAALGAGLLALGLAAALFSTTGPALVSLAKDYASAATEADKQVFATAAAGVSSTNEPIISSTLIGAGVIFVSLAIMRGASEKWLVYLGFAAGALNIVRNLPYVVNYFILTEIFVVLSATWIFGTGRLVYRLAGRA